MQHRMYHWDFKDEAPKCTIESGVPSQAPPSSGHWSLLTPSVVILIHTYSTFYRPMSAPVECKPRVFLKAFVQEIAWHART